MTSDSEPQLYALACVRCKRQKVKCDRILPSCNNCVKSRHDCVYPAEAKKPGPKPGTSRRRAHSPDQDHYPNGTRLLGKEPKQARTDSSSASPSDPRPGVLTGCSLSTLIHPIPTIQQEESVANYALRDPANPNQFTRAMDALGIEANELLKLVDIYFDNVTTWGLFHKPTFHHKIAAIDTITQVKALLMSIIAVSRRFVDKGDPSMPFCAHHSTSDLLVQAIELSKQCIDECGDEIAPLCVLQSMLINTFLLLTQGVRSRAYRMNVACVGLAYDLQLHIEDAADDPSYIFFHEKIQRSQTPVAREERRRLWWAVWETDIFAANMKRLPATLDHSLNKTYLPCSDDDWFNGRAAKSCFMPVNPVARWQELSNSGNKRSRAWQLLMYSYKHDSFILSSSPTLLARRFGFDDAITAPTEDMQHGTRAREIRDMLENCIKCGLMAMPPELAYADRYLSFSRNISFGGATQRQLDAARYNIHAMTNLTNFMLFRREVYANAAEKKSTNPSCATARKGPTGTKEANTVKAWNRYLHAAAAVSALARNSSPDHYKYVNPWLANVMWYSAASQVITVLFGPPSVNKQLISSNFELLRSTLVQFIDFWGLPEMLIQNLDTLGHRVDQMIDREFERNGVQSRNGRQTSPKHDSHNEFAVNEIIDTVKAADKLSLKNRQPPTSAAEQVSSNTLDPALQGSGQSDQFSMMLTDDFLNEMATSSTDFNHFEFDVNDFFFDPFTLQDPA